MICVTRLNGVFLIGLKNYPRRCGENPSPPTQHVVPAGSSPQVRGKLSPTRSQGIFPRLIPAGAGKTWTHPLGRPTRSAHPRRCGENSLSTRVRKVAVGSSPQVRGKPDIPAFDRPKRRLIPAGAGKTVYGDTFRIAATAHPRRCGENARSSSSVPTVYGSSPQVRGKLSCLYGTYGLLRLIPAGAGKTTP